MGKIICMARLIPAFRWEVSPGIETALIAGCPVRALREPRRLIAIWRGEGGKLYIARRLVSRIGKTGSRQANRSTCDVLVSGAQNVRLIDRQRLRGRARVLSSSAINIGVHGCGKH